MGGGDCRGFPNFNIAIFYLAKQNKNKTKQKKLSRMKVKEKPIQTNRLLHLEKWRLFVSVPEQWTEIVE